MQLFEKIQSQFLIKLFEKKNDHYPFSLCFRILRVKNHAIMRSAL